MPLPSSVAERLGLAVTAVVVLSVLVVWASVVVGLAMRIVRALNGW